MVGLVGRARYSRKFAQCRYRILSGAFHSYRQQSRGSGIVHSRVVAVIVSAGLCLSSASAQTITINANEAAAHVNQYATVEGIVAKLFTSKAGNTFLNIGAAYPNQTFHRLDSAVLRPKANSLSPKLTGSCSGDLLNACLDFEPLTDLYTSTWRKAG
jgi:hypothetical protein